MIPEKEDDRPAYGERTVEESYRLLKTRIRQLEDEVARYRAVNENARAETARACLVAWWGSKRVYLEEGEDVEPAIVASVHLLEQALAAQAEMENGNG